LQLDTHYLRSALVEFVDDATSVHVLLNAADQVRF
jgi:hypothetical protein